MNEKIASNKNLNEILYEIFLYKVIEERNSNSEFLKILFSFEIM